MSKRFGRNQKRAFRAEIDDLNRQIRSLHYAVHAANDRAKPFDAQHDLIRRIAGQLGEEMKPYVERMMKSDERGARYLPLVLSEVQNMEATFERTMQATFDLRCRVRF